MITENTSTFNMRAKVTGGHLRHRLTDVFTRLYKSLEYFALQSAASLKARFALHRLIRLRQRYLLTKANKVRLRYVTAFCIAAVLALGASMSSLAMKISQELMRPGPISTQTAMISQETVDSAVKTAIQTRISDGMRKAAIAIKKPPKPLFKELKIGRGDTVAGVLEAAGLSSTDSYYAVKAMSEHYDPRKVRPGQKIQVHFKQAEMDEVDFSRMTMKLDPTKEVSVIKIAEDRFTADLQVKELVKRSHAVQAEIETSLYGSAARAGLPPQVIAEVIRIYSWDVDFQRDIRRGDKIEVLYDTQETEDGEFARYGDVLYASLSVGGKNIPVYRYEMKDGRVDYFEPDGFSVRKALMKTPVDGARISSGYGLRKHPVLGYNKMHKGMDFAAPTGTPIYAAGDGVIDYKGRKGGYGNYIRIRHNGSLKTAYAHMHKYARGMGVGKRVEQGQVIGYVGSTGRSTGPHLHYEVHVDSKQVNPRSIDLPVGEQLEGEEFARFRGLMGALYQQYVALSDGLKFAQNNYR